MRKSKSKSKIKKKQNTQTLLRVSADYEVVFMLV